MRLPEELLAAIQREAGKTDQQSLTRASAELTHRYKTENFSAPAIAGQTQRAAYLIARLPATYAANWNVLSEVRRLAPDLSIETLLDLGGGPGTALFAAAEIFPALRQATVLESDEAWLQIGKALARESPHQAVQAAQWINQDLRAGFGDEVHDLVVISYALGELSHAAREAVLQRAWSCAGKLLIIIEPGTMRGFANVHAVRSALIASGAHVIAPCPHQNACPMAGTRDWCHFAQRVERTSWHRQIKGGSLAYEDEKFSYVAACRQDAARAGSRIVRHPQKHSGHVQLVLCTKQQRIETKVVTRSDRERYKLARHAEWGGAWEG
jgi:ribosomal protein RSM22 (predicted rRNA methylase)